MAFKTPTAIRDRSITDLDLVKSHLRIESTNTTWDTILEMYLKAVKEKADYYCQNPFISNGEEQDIPAGVELWILQQTAQLFGQPEGNISRSSIDGHLTTEFIINDYDLDYRGLKPYRLEVGFGL
jgi:hypothetical protein